MVFSMLAKIAKRIKFILITYDIVCAWAVNLIKRYEAMYGDVFDLADDVEMSFAVPKFHLEAHGEDCKCAFNLNNTVGAGRTCGEGIEAGWADTNACALSTREMSAAHRHEVLEDFFQSINFRKIINMGTLFLAAQPDVIR